MSSLALSGKFSKYNTGMYSGSQPLDTGRVRDLSSNTEWLFENGGQVLVNTATTGVLSFGGSNTPFPAAPGVPALCSVWGPFQVQANRTNDYHAGQLTVPVYVKFVGASNNTSEVQFHFFLASPTDRIDSVINSFTSGTNWRYQSVGSATPQWYNLTTGGGTDIFLRARTDFRTNPGYVSRESPQNLTTPQAVQNLECCLYCAIVIPSTNVSVNAGGYLKAVHAREAPFIDPR